MCLSLLFQTLSSLKTVRSKFYMANIYKRFKKKNRSSDSDLETISPEEEEKSLCDKASHMDNAITGSPGEEDKIIETRL